jgi:hypothetical protein
MVDPLVFPPLWHLELSQKAEILQNPQYPMTYSVPFQLLLTFQFPIHPRTHSDSMIRYTEGV